LHKGDGKKAVHQSKEAKTKKGSELEGPNCRNVEKGD